MKRLVLSLAIVGFLAESLFTAHVARADSNNGKLLISVSMNLCVYGQCIGFSEDRTNGCMTISMEKRQATLCPENDMYGKFTQMQFLSTLATIRTKGLNSDQIDCLSLATLGDETSIINCLIKTNPVCDESKFTPVASLILKNNQVVDAVVNEKCLEVAFLGGSLSGQVPFSVLNFVDRSAGDGLLYSIESDKVTSKSFSEIGRLEADHIIRLLAEREGKPQDRINALTKVLNKKIKDGIFIAPEINKQNNFNRDLLKSVGYK